MGNGGNGSYIRTRCSCCTFYTGSSTQSTAQSGPERHASPLSWHIWVSRRSFHVWSYCALSVFRRFLNSLNSSTHSQTVSQATQDRTNENDKINILNQSEPNTPALTHSVFSESPANTDLCMTPFYYSAPLSPLEQKPFLSLESRASNQYLQESTLTVDNALGLIVTGDDDVEGLAQTRSAMADSHAPRSAGRELDR